MQRINDSPSAYLEDKFFKSVVPKIPPIFTSDFLTAISFFSTFLAGIFYFLTKYSFFFLLLVNVCIVINWFADGADGKVAIYRKKARPRYGYYIDHMVDSFGICFICLGIFFSGLTNSPFWFIGGLLLLLIYVHTFLQVTVLNKLTLSIGKISPTDGRILLILLNTILVIWGNKTYTFLGFEMNFFDYMGVIFDITLGLVLFIVVYKTARKLIHLDTVK